MSCILLADDSPQALRLGEQILSGQGWQIVSVTDGATALRRVEDARPDLIIADVYLASRNAFEIARALRAQSQFAQVPIIFAAAPADEFQEQDAKNAGADAIVRKPFEASTLLAAVRELLGREKTAVGPGSATVDRHTVRAAVTLALDTAMPVLVEELTERVMLALAQRP